MQRLPFSLAVLRAAAWACVVLIAYLSLIPQSMEVRTGFPGGLEHVVAYGGTAMLMQLAYPKRSGLLIVAALFAYSGFLEVLQTFSPGRHPGLNSALASGAGATLGVLLHALWDRIIHPVR